MCRTKIVCTLGPATDAPEVLREMIQEGTRVVRLNFSHGSHDSQGQRVEAVRRLSREMDTFVGVMADLQGPKLRIGEMVGGAADLQEGDSFILTARSVAGDARQVTFDHPDVISSIRPGARILLDDGLLELRAERIEGPTVTTTVVVGGSLGSRKGVTLPDTELTLGSLTDKDRDDARFAASLGVDYFALSFVRSPSNVRNLRDYLKGLGSDVPIVAKIEKKAALDHIPEILEASDAIMVARGDLGVETPPEDVPIHQKMIVKQCNAAGKPVIIATQMLQSMIDNPRPTRAEASDVANAILDGSDAIMLSGETAIGHYPVDAVRMMSRIADVTEVHFPYANHVHEIIAHRTPSVTDAIGQATSEIAEELGAKAIIASTRSGQTARMVAKYRAPLPIFAPTPDARVAAQLSLVWGVQPMLVRQFASTDEMIEESVEAVKATGAVAAGDIVVITAGVPMSGAGRTNMLKVHVVE